MVNTFTKVLKGDMFYLHQQMLIYDLLRIASKY